MKDFEEQFPSLVKYPSEDDEMHYKWFTEKQIKNTCIDKEEIKELKKLMLSKNSLLKFQENNKNISTINSNVWRDGVDFGIKYFCKELGLED